MSDSKIQKVATTSENIPNDNLEKLRSVFPSFVKDREVDFDALQAFLKTEWVLAGEEKYGLSWAGKSNAFRAIRTPATGTLTPQPEESKNWDTTQNIFIEWDNLEVLKLLQKHYRGEIKMIYIDPPYNTGKDFVYKDNFTKWVADYYEQTGQTKDGIKMTANTEKNGRYHSDWLTMMYPRLFLAHNLLREDGVIFVSIDDNEVANLRMIMDEIFGEENFVSNLIWQKNYSPRNDTRYFSDMHDHILCYAKNKLDWDRNLLPRTDEQNERYTNRDGDVRWPWKAENFTVKTYSANYDYPIETPSWKIVHPPKGRCWRSPKEKFFELVSDNRIWFWEKGDNVPSKKSFLSEVQQGSVPTTIFFRDKVGDNQEAANQLKDLFWWEVYFDTPKPIRLIKHLLYIATSTNKNDLIFDFFSGSGTTAHAVMELNAEDEGNRRFICVQLPETTEEESEAYKAGYKKISDISRERIRRAGDKIWKGDIGFKSFVLEQSNYRQWNTLTDSDDAEVLRAQMKLFAEKPLVDDVKEEPIVYEILIKEGFDLNAKVEKIETKNKKRIFVVEDGGRRLFISFAESFSQDEVTELKLWDADTFVCFDSALDDTTKINLVRNFNIKVI